MAPAAVQAADQVALEIAPEAKAADTKKAVKGVKGLPGKIKTKFAQRNPHLEKLVPDAIENFVDALIPDALEKKLDGGAKSISAAYSKFSTDFNEGFGEIAAVLFKIAKYATSKFNLGDVVFGIYHLSEHHNSNDVFDSVEGKQITDPDTLKWLLYCTDMAVMSYSPTKEKLCAAVQVPEEDVVIFQPKANANRPAYAVCLDHISKNVVWGFRGTTDLSDMLTDVCGVCKPYQGGYAHWGMLSAAEWFAENELANVRAVCDKHPGYGLLLVGHSLGAGVAALMAHWIHNQPEASAMMKGINVRAVGVATPAVLSADLAEGCSEYITSVVLQHDIVPRFSIYNMFEMKREMDDTKWGDILADKIKDWMVPDVIEKSQTYQRLTRHVSSKFDRAFRFVINGIVKLFMRLAGVFLYIFRCTACRKKPKTANDEDDEADSGDADPELAPRGSMADRARAMAAKHDRAAQAEMDDPGMVADVAAAVKEKMDSTPFEDVHACYAPGRLVYLRRRDPEITVAELETAAVAVGVPVTQADTLQLVVADDNGAAAPDAVEPMTPTTAAAVAAVEKVKRRAAERERKRALAKAKKEAAKARAEERKRAREERKANKGKKAAEAAEPEPPEDPFPGATFEVIQGAPGQRFKRIVLRETCVMDHMCGGYIQALEYAIAKHQDPAAVDEIPSRIAAAAHDLANANAAEFKASSEARRAAIVGKVKKPSK